MTQRFIESDTDKEYLVRLINRQEAPFTVTINKGGRRSVEQNRLNRLWVNEISEQLEGWRPEEVRAYCKLTIGVPLLRHENEDFRERYDEIVMPLPYQAKLKLMSEPLDFPVTRLMSMRQQTQYLEEVFQHFAEQGVMLSIPPEKKYGLKISSKERVPA